MKMHLEHSDQRLITDYGPGSISVDGVAFRNAIMISPEAIVENWFEDDISSLELEDLEPVLKQKPEILIVGSGTNHRFPPPRLMVELAQQGIALGVMSTSAACRTYNVLVSEARNVSAALLQI